VDFNRFSKKIVTSRQSIEYQACVSLSHTQLSKQPLHIDHQSYMIAKKLASNSIIVQQLSIK